MTIPLEKILSVLYQDYEYNFDKVPHGNHLEKQFIRGVKGIIDKLSNYYLSNRFQNLNSENQLTVFEASLSNERGTIIFKSRTSSIFFLLAVHLTYPFTHYATDTAMT